MRARWRLKPHEASEGYTVKMVVFFKKKKGKVSVASKELTPVLSAENMQIPKLNVLPAIIGCALNLCVLGSSTATLISIQAFFSRHFVVGASAI